MQTQPLLIVNCAEKRVRDFVETLCKIAKDLHCNYKQIEYKDLPHTELKKIEAILLSGSPCGDDIVEHHRPYFESLRRYNKALLGICAGHHILGRLHGAQLIREEQKEIGSISVLIKTTHPIFEGVPSEFEAQAMHHDSITVPEGFTAIASSHICPNQVMQSDHKPWFTFQFHPELGNERIIQNFLNFYAKQK